MEELTTTQTSAWLQRWMEDVRQSGAMSQRKRSSIERLGGGLNEAAKAAREQGIHLLLLTDERGQEVVAASRSPFRVLA